MTSDEIRQHIEMLLADSKSRHRDIELLFETTSKLAEAAKADSAKITGLVKASQSVLRIAEAHERSLSRLGSGGESGKNC